MESKPRWLVYICLKVKLIIPRKMLSTYSIEDREALSTASAQLLSFLTFSSTGTFQAPSPQPFKEAGNLIEIISRATEQVVFHE
jgi:hypothetical protein